MKRRLLNLLTALSLLLCIAACVLWVRSYRVCDRLTIQREKNTLDRPLESHRTEFYARRGRIILTRSHEHRERGQYFGFGFGNPGDDLDSSVLLVSEGGAALEMDPEPPVNGWEWGGARFDRFADSRPLSAWELAVPLWALAAAGLLLPGARLVRFGRARSTRRRGRCTRCGYELGATLGACPECGDRPGAVGNRSELPARTMAALRRRLANFLTTLSLLLCVTTLFLWPFTRSRAEGICCFSGRDNWRTEWLWNVASHRCVVYVIQHRDDRPTPSRGITFRPIAYSSNLRIKPVLGFDFMKYDRVSSMELYASAPHWAVALVTAAAPAVWLARFQRDRRRAAKAARGLCRACGYDLRETPTRCPECGTIP
jgi:hypothetical protein